MEEKAIELVSKLCEYNCTDKNINKIKKMAIICVQNEYYSNRELLFNLKSHGVEISEKVYLSRLQGLIDEEKLLIEEIQKL